MKNSKGDENGCEEKGRIVSVWRAVERRRGKRMKLTSTVFVSLGEFLRRSSSGSESEVTAQTGDESCRNER